MSVPAAHSMDTEWFAIDREGHVALFVSGEPGAVPSSTVDHIGQRDPIEDALLALPATSDVLVELTRHPGLLDDADPPRRLILVRWPDPGEIAVIVYRSEPVLPEVLRGLPELSLDRVGRYFVLTLRSATTRSRTEPHAAAWCELVGKAARDPAFVTARDASMQQAGVARRGVFVYDEGARLNIAEPYLPRLVPTVPVHVDQLDEKLAALLRKRPRLPVSFADRTPLQPVEHVTCQAWSALYLASDGVTVRPIPGHESEYEEEAWSIDVEDDGYEPIRFDPPLEQG